jgi:hypothetical protein
VCVCVCVLICVCVCGWCGPDLATQQQDSAMFQAVVRKGSGRQPPRSLTTYYRAYNP